MNNINVTILIPTFNRSRALQAVWPSYFTSRHVKEVIVVSDGSTDDTEDVVRVLAKNSSILVTLIVHPKQLGAPAARQTAVRAATTEWVLFGEDDVWLDQDYVETLLRQSALLECDAIAGRLLTALVPAEFDHSALTDSRSKLQEPFYDMQNLSCHFESCPPSPLQVPHLHVIALIRRQLFSIVNFDTWFRGNAFREETDFFISLNELGYKVYFTPDTRCFHLRGPICVSGGQRRNRLIVEYWHFINTWHLVRKHWDYLSKVHNFRLSCADWMCRYFIRRQLGQLRRLLVGDYHSSLRGK